MSSYKYFFFQSKLQTKDTGKHLQATEDYLQQHSLLETQLKALSKRVRNLNRRSKQIEPSHQEGRVMDKRLEDLNKDLDRCPLPSHKLVPINLLCYSEFHFLLTLLLYILISI